MMIAVLCVYKGLLVFTTAPSMEIAEENVIRLLKESGHDVNGVAVTLIVVDTTHEGGAVIPLYGDLPEGVSDGGMDGWTENGWEGE